jgi:hypothetical protein
MQPAEGVVCSIRTLGPHLHPDGNMSIFVVSIAAEAGSPFRPQSFEM